MKDARSKGVIFDLDGGLIDTVDYHRQSWYDLARQQGWVFSDEFFRKTFGMQNYQIIPLIAKRQLSSEEIIPAIIEC